MITESDETYLILSGMKVVNDRGTFYFSEPGEWVTSDGGLVTYDKLHRDNEPAVIGYDNSVRWYHYGKLHRMDGPAIIHSNGTCEFWRNGYYSSSIVPDGYKT